LDLITGVFDHEFIEQPDSPCPELAYGSPDMGTDTACPFTAIFFSLKGGISL